MANTPINAMTATWGSGDQVAIKMNVADSGPSNAGSRLLDLQVGGNSKFKVTKEGYVSATNFTGSFSGSSYISNAAGYAGTVYPIFSTGVSGKQVLRVDNNGLTYSPSLNTLSVAGDINIGGTLDTDNSTGIIYITPSITILSPNSTEVYIGSAGVGSYTQIDTYQVRANSFKGAFTGSISGSNARFTNITSKNIIGLYSINAPSLTGSISSSFGRFLNISGANATFKGRVVAASFTGSISGSRARFLRLSASNARIAGRVNATSFTGSISGGYARLLNISGGNATFGGRVVATSFTGSFSASLFKIANLSGANATFGGRVIANSFTGSISGGYARFSNISGGNAAFSGRVVATSFTGSISGGYARLLNISGGNATFSGRVVATSFTGSISGSRARFFRLTASNALITRLTSTSLTTTSIRSTSFTGSISGSFSKFINISGANASITSKFYGRSISGSHTGSISGSSAKFLNISGGNAIFSGKLVATSFTGSISGSRARFSKLSASNVTIVNRVLANSFTGSISGSVGKFFLITGSTVNATEITGNFYGNTATFVNLSLSSITASITGNKGIFTQVSGANATFSGRVIANSFTGSTSGSVYVHDTAIDDTHYLTFGDLSKGTTILYTDTDLLYNPHSNKITTGGDFLIGKSIDSIGDPINVFSSSTEMTFGYNLVNLYLANKSSKIDIGSNFSITNFSGSITSSICRSSKLSSSNALISRKMLVLGGLHASSSFTSSFVRVVKYLSGSRAKINNLTSSFITSSKGAFTRLTSSNSQFSNFTASNVYVTNFITASNINVTTNQVIENNLVVRNKASITGSLNLRRSITGSTTLRKTGTLTGASGAIPIKIGNVTYYIPLYTTLS